VISHIYTADTTQPLAEALVVHGDRIAFVGSQQEAVAHAAPHAGHSSSTAVPFSPAWPTPTRTS